MLSVEKGAEVVFTRLIQEQDFEKGAKPLHGKPLISYAIENALRCNNITDIVVSSDSDEILSIARKYPISTIIRGSELAGDTITLDPVIHDALVQMEVQKNTYL